MILKKVCLNACRNAHVVVTAVEGEVGSRFIQITLLHYDQPLDLTEKTVAIYMTKPDRTVVYNRCEIIDPENGIILVSLTSQMSAVAGTITDCEIHVIGTNGSLLKILGLTIVIERSLENDEAIESANEMTLLLDALEKTDGIANVVTEALQQKIREFDAIFTNQSEHFSTQFNQMITDSDNQMAQKLQNFDINLSHANQKLEKVLTDARQSVESAVSSANLAVVRVNEAIDQIEEVSGELVAEAIEMQKNEINGIAGLDHSGKLMQMPTAADVGAVPTTRMVNNQGLSGDITLSAVDVDAVPITRTVNGKALSGNITLSANDIGPVAKTDIGKMNGVAGLNSSGKLTNMPTAADVGAVPTTRMVNNKALSANISLSAVDVDAVPITRTVNGKALSDNITLTVNDIGVDNLFLAVYPVGSIYMTTVVTNPGMLFGGTWVAWGSGRVPVGVNTADANFNTVNKTGGSKTHILTVDEIPKHTHSQLLYWSGEQGTNQVVSPALETNDPRQYTTYPFTGAAGGGQSHNNLQPYITCYMWRRTA